LNQTTHPADGPVYRQFQIVWIDKHTFPSVVDLKFGLAFRTDSFPRIGISDRIETERAFQNGGIVKGVHEKEMPLIFVCKNIKLILHTKIRVQMKSVRQNILLTYLNFCDYTDRKMKTLAKDASKHLEVACPNLITPRLG
jgi:hypothetical protein